MTMKDAKAGRTILGMATIWQNGQYKVTLYPDRQEGSHKERHLHVNVSSGNETGAVSLNDGRLLNGNLSRRTLNWCQRTLLNPVCKKRIVKMLDEDVYYRLDRPDEVRQHPLGDSRPSGKRKSSALPKWGDMFIENVLPLGGYLFRIRFSDGAKKEIDLEPAMRELPGIYQRLLDDPSLAYAVKFDALSIFWDDLMDFASDYLYEHGTEVEEL